MDPFRESLAKALTGEPGDKRNTKYALAGAGGLALGVNLGNQLGARSAGTTLTQNRREVLAALKAHSDSVKAELAAHPLPQESRKARRIRIKHNKDVKRGRGGTIIPAPKIPTASNYTPPLRLANKIANSVKGTKAIHRGGEAGMVLGAVGGMAAYGAYRKHKRDRVAKYWEGTPKPERRKIAFTDAALGAATGMAVGGAAAYALTRGKVKIKRVKVPGKTKVKTKTVEAKPKPKAKPTEPSGPPKQLKLKWKGAPKPKKAKPASPEVQPHVEIEGQLPLWGRHKKIVPDKTYLPQAERAGKHPDGPKQKVDRRGAISGGRQPGRVVGPDGKPRLQKTKSGQLRYKPLPHMPKPSDTPDEVVSADIARRQAQANWLKIGRRRRAAEASRAAEEKTARRAPSGGIPRAASNAMDADILRRRNAFGVKE